MRTTVPPHHAEAMRSIIDRAFGPITPEISANYRRMEERSREEWRTAGRAAGEVRPGLSGCSQKDHW